MYFLIKFVLIIEVFKYGSEYTEEMKANPLKITVKACGECAVPAVLTSV